MKRTAVAAVLLMGVIAVQLSAQDAKQVRDKVDGTVEIEKNTQQQQDDWAALKAELTSRYKAAKAGVEYLEAQKSLMTKEVTAFEDAISELERRLDESDRLQASLQDTLNTIVTDLDQWIARDLPFLAEERQARIEALKNEIAKPDVTGAEKLRRVLEALQVEANYGNTVEVYTEGIDVNGEELFVDIFRVGRVSVFWRTADGRRAGEFDRASGQWVELSSKASRNIGMAMEMASRVRPVEIISLPLGRISP